MKRSLVTTVAILIAVLSGPRLSHAVDERRIQELERQVTEMQKELQSLRQERKQEEERTQKQKIESERKTSILAEEFEKLKTNLTVPEDTAYKSAYGLGPAASKIYGTRRGLSIGGYVEGFYSKSVSDKTRANRDNADFLRLVTYIGYKFNDWILFNSEIELEHGSTSTTKTSGSGEVSVEFAYLDFLLSEYANVRAGMLLIPMGFLNEMHEPNTFHGVFRPEVETRIIPSTWRENGVGLFGKIGESLQYRLYAVNGLNARGFSVAGLRGGRQKGNRALAEDISITGRLDYTPITSLLLGGSFYLGDQGNNQDVSGTRIPDSHLALWEVHGQYRAYGLELRGLFTMAHLGDARALTSALRKTKDVGTNDTIANTMLGTYAEVAYDILPHLYANTDHYLAPFVRFEYYNTQDNVPAGFSRNGNAAQRLWTSGLSYKPHPNVVLKVDYRRFSAVKGVRPHEVNFGIGLAF